MPEIGNDDKILSADVNRRSMGIWLVATIIAVLLELAAIVYGVGSIIDWILLSLFGGIAAVLARLVFDKRPVLIINEVGVLDRRLGSGIMRWEDMLWHRLYTDMPIPQLALGLTDEQSKKAGIYPWAFVYKNLPGPFGKIKGYRVWPHRTRADKEAFVAAVEHFAPNRYDDNE